MNTAVGQVPWVAMDPLFQGVSGTLNDRPTQAMPQ